MYLFVCPEQLGVQSHGVIGPFLPRSDNVYIAEDEFVDLNAELGGEGEETGLRSVWESHCVIG